ncbi:MAG: hypothetical protein CFE46_13280 [Burkholderiales bacterium PBB6]|nr:MAG: hypothetical protein CFE46_13280 [Burkholderiales bacterium PBB6]
MRVDELFEGRVGLPTSEMAILLNRKPQTLRRWAAYENGPLKPRLVNGRLFWPLDDAIRLLEGPRSQR